MSDTPIELYTPRPGPILQEFPSPPHPSVPVREPLQQGPTGVGVSLDVETVNSKRIDGKFVYSAKFVCGKIPHSAFDPQDPPPEFPLVPGTYRTAINVNNPNLLEVHFTKMALITNPESQPRGKAGDPVHFTLGPNEGIEVDCQDIESLLTTGSGVDVFNNTNVDGVYNSPPYSPTFSLKDPTVIKQLITYHWYDGKGDAPGHLSLIDQTGNVVVGPIAATGTPGQNGVPNANWVADVNPPKLIPAGVYTMRDDKPQSWSWNPQSRSAGFAIVRGSPSFVGRAPFIKGFVVLRSDLELDVVGVYTVKNVISSAPFPTQHVGPRVAPLDITLIATQQVLVGKPNISFVELTWSVTGGQEPVDVRITVDGPVQVGRPLAGHLTWEQKSRSGTSTFPNPQNDYRFLTTAVQGGFYSFTATVTDASVPPLTASTQATIVIL